MHSMDKSILHAQIVGVSSVLFQSQGNHIHNMDIAFLGLHFESNSSHMHHMEIFFLHA